MEKHVYLSSLNEELLGEEITGVYFLAEIKRYTSQKKDCYLGKIRDKSGELHCEIPVELNPQAYMKSPIEVEAVLSMYKGELQMEIHTLHIAAENKDTAAILILGISAEEILQEQIALKDLLCISPDVNSVLNKVYRKGSVTRLSSVPGNYPDGFSYNGGLLDRTVYLLRLVNSIKQTLLPIGAIEHTEICWDIVSGAVALCSMADVGTIHPMPDGSQNTLTGGMDYLPMVIEACRDSVIGDKLLHCLRAHLGYAAETPEAKVVAEVFRLGNLIGEITYGRG